MEMGIEFKDLIISTSKIECEFVNIRRRYDCEYIGLRGALKEFF